MMTTLLLLAFIFITGIALVLFSKKLKFNPFIGFRVGYSMVSEEAWRRLNKVSGYALSILSLVLTPLIFLEEASYG